MNEIDAREYVSFEKEMKKAAGESLKEVRLEEKMTQKQVAKICGVNLNYLGEAECHGCSMPYLAYCLHKLGYSLEWSIVPR